MGAPIGPPLKVLGDPMGDRTHRPSGQRAGSGKDGDGAAGGSYLQRLLADPRTRAKALRLLRAQKEQQAAKKAAAASKREGGEGAEGGEGGGEADAEAEAEADAKAELAREERKEKKEAEEAARDADRVPLAKHDEIGAHGAHSHEEGEEYARKDTVSGGVSADARDVHVSLGRESEVHGDEEAGDEYRQSTAVEAGLGIKNGEFAGELKTSQKHEDEDGADETSQSVAIEDKKLELAVGHKKETKDPNDKEAKPSAKGWDAGVEIGAEGVGGELASEKENADGSKRRTKVAAELGENQISGSAAHTITSKSGNSVTLSVKGGIQVEASEPVRVGPHRFIVSYKRTKTVAGGVGGGGHGVGVKVGASSADYETGTRAFETKQEADEFKEHAAAMLLHEEPDPRSVEGAMRMEVGESRGRGHADGESAGATGAFEGASLGVSGQEQASEEVSVRRVSETVFEVTHEHAEEEGGALTGGGGGVELSRTRSSNRHRSVTVRFDVGTPEGKQGFEQFCKDHKLPARGARSSPPIAARGRSAATASTSPRSATTPSPTAPRRRRASTTRASTRPTRASGRTRAIRTGPAGCSARTSCTPASTSPPSRRTTRTRATPWSARSAASRATTTATRCSSSSAPTATSGGTRARSRPRASGP